MVHRPVAGRQGPRARIRPGHGVTDPSRTVTACVTANRDGSDTRPAGPVPTTTVASRASARTTEIGRASCRERVEILVVGGSLKKNNRITSFTTTQTYGYEIRTSIVTCP